MSLVSYNPGLVLASLLVAIMASFTGLRLASGLEGLDPARRKTRIAKAAVAMGGGIWSMHFIGMLAMRISAELSYDALLTLGSALVAILITGVGLLLLHFGERTTRRIWLAGAVTGLGIVSMHYIGMAAIGGSRTVVYDPPGYFVSSAIAIASSTCGLWLAYKRRALPHLAVGSAMLGIAISAMHYSAMAFTHFLPAIEAMPVREPILSSGVLALLVALAAFLICGFFLLTAIPIERLETRSVVPRTPVRLSVVEHAGASAGDGILVRPADSRRMLRLPYEQNNTIRFLPIEEVFAVQADGHYTRLYNGSEQLFCPWPISRVEETLERSSFMRTHRSYLVNLRHVKGFHRDGDKAFCILANRRQDNIPVSRSRIAMVREALQLA